MPFLFEYYRLVEKESYDISLIWKGSHMCLLILCAASSIICSFNMYSLSSAYDDSCVLYPKMVLVNNESMSRYKGDISRDSNATMPMYTIKWSDPNTCLYTSFLPILSAVCSFIWMALFFMCARGGRSVSGLSSSWRIIVPAFVFSTTFAILSLISTVRVTMGLRAFCNKFSVLTKSTICDSRIDVYTLQWNSKIQPAFSYHNLIISSSWMYTISWATFAVSLLLRCIFIVDFDLAHVVVATMGLPGDGDNRIARYENRWLKTFIGLMHRVRAFIKNPSLMFHRKPKMPEELELYSESMLTLQVSVVNFIRASGEQVDSNNESAVKFLNMQEGRASIQGVRSAASEDSHDLISLFKGKIPPAQSEPMLYNPSTETLKPHILLEHERKTKKRVHTATVHDSTKAPLRTDSQRQSQEFNAIPDGTIFERKIEIRRLIKELKAEIANAETVLREIEREGTDTQHSIYKNHARIETKRVDTSTVANVDEAIKTEAGNDSTLTVRFKMVSKIEIDNSIITETAFSSVQRTLSLQRTLPSETDDPQSEENNVKINTKDKGELKSTTEFEMDSRTTKENDESTKTNKEIGLKIDEGKGAKNFTATASTPNIEIGTLQGWKKGDRQIARFVHEHIQTKVVSDTRRIFYQSNPEIDLRTKSKRFVFHFPNTYEISFERRLLFDITSGGQKDNEIKRWILTSDEESVPIDQDVESNPTDEVKPLMPVMKKDDPQPGTSRDLDATDSVSPGNIRPNRLSSTLSHKHIVNWQWHYEMPTLRTHEARHVDESPSSASVMATARSSVIARKDSQIERSMALSSHANESITDRRDYENDEIEITNILRSDSFDALSTSGYAHVEKTNSIASNADLDNIIDRALNNHPQVDDKVVLCTLLFIMMIALNPFHR